MRGNLVCIVVSLVWASGCEVADIEPLHDVRDTRDDTRDDDTGVADTRDGGVDSVDSAETLEPDVASETIEDVAPDVTTVDAADADAAGDVEEADAVGDAPDIELDSEVAVDVVDDVAVTDVLADVTDSDAVTTEPDVPVDVTLDVTPDVPGDTSACVMTTTTTAPIASPHVAVCSAVSYPTEPPTSGPHYPIWAEYKTYVDPVPRGFYVHNLEHGAVVITYHCPTDGPDSCATELAAIATLLDARPADPLCFTPIRERVVVTPDPLSPTRFAVAAWGASLTGDCLDVQQLAAFMDAHYGQGSEATCSQGVDVTVPGLGTYCPPTP